MRIFASICLTFLLFVPVVVLGQAPTPPATASGGACTANYSGAGLCNAIPGVANIPSFISAAFIWLGTVIGMLALVMVIYSGAQMIISQGDSGALTKAKTNLTYSIVGLLVILSAYIIVSAVQYFIGSDPLNPGSTGSNSFFINPIGETSLAKFVEDAIKSFLGLVGGISILYIVINGFRLVTAAGNEEQAKKARGGITWAVIGLVCIILAYVIVVAVINSLGAASV